MSFDLYSETDEDLKGVEPNSMDEGFTSDSSGNGTRFAKRTGIFSIDFPASPKTSKGKGKKSVKVIPATDSNNESDVPNVKETWKDEGGLHNRASASDSDVNIQPSGIITRRNKRSRVTSKMKQQCQDEIPPVGTKESKGTLPWISLGILFIEIGEICQ